MFHKLNKNKQQAFDLDNLWLDRVCKTQLLGAEGSGKDGSHAS